jgi:replicative DNA helicase
MNPEITKALPHSEESERAVLASILLLPHLLPVIAGRLSATDFYLDRHRLIYNGLVAVADVEGVEDVDMRTLQAHLELAGDFETIGGMAYLAGLDLDLPDLGRIETYVEIVKERSVRRRLIQASQQITFDAFESGADASAMLADAGSTIRDLAAESQRMKARPRWEIFNAIVCDIEEAETRPRGISTGFAEWDMRTGGLLAELVTIGGGTGIGKSILGRQIAEHVARHHGPVHYWSGEMDDKALELRAVAAGAGVDHQALRRGQVSEADMQKALAYMREFDELPIQIMDKPGFNVSDIEAAAMSAGNLAAVFVDYLTLMEPPPGKWRTKREEVGETTRRLKQLSRRMNAPVVLMAQLNREAAHRPPWEPEVHHLAESASIERDSDLVALIYPRLLDPDLEDYSKWKARNPRETWLKVAKHRSAEDGYRIALNLVPQFVRFEQAHHDSW